MQSKYGKAMRKKLPEERYSKLPVSVIRPMQGKGNKEKSYDPRFRNDGREANTQNYDFIEEIQSEKLKELKQLKKQAAKREDRDLQIRISDLIGEEKQIRQNIKKQKEDNNTLTNIKSQNKERIDKGLNPIFKKKRDIKATRLETKYDDLEKKGKLDKFMDFKRRKL